MIRRTPIATIGPVFLGWFKFCQSNWLGLYLIPFILFATLLFGGDARASTGPESAVSAAEATTPVVDLAALKQFVHDYWQQRFEQYAERVNWRDYQWQIEVTIPEAVSKLPPCRQPYQAETVQVHFPVGRQRLRLRCPDTPGWFITTRSQVSVLMPVVVTRIALDPEHYLQAGDLAVTQILLTAQQGDVLTDLAQAVGRRPQRALRAGQPVRNKMLEAALLVRKGDKVSLTMVEGGLSISMEGTALQDGQKGEIISIKNEKSGKNISATVSGPGQLQILNEPLPVPPHQ